MTYRERMRRFIDEVRFSARWKGPGIVERMEMWIVWHLPRWIIYFATVRCWAHGTTSVGNDTEATALTVDAALKRWGVPR